MQITDIFFRKREFLARGGAPGSPVSGPRGLPPRPTLAPDSAPIGYYFFRGTNPFFTSRENNNSFSIISSRVIIIFIISSFFQGVRFCRDRSPYRTYLQPSAENSTAAHDSIRRKCTTGGSSWAVFRGQLAMIYISLICKTFSFPDHDQIDTCVLRQLHPVQQEKKSHLHICSFLPFNCFLFCPGIPNTFLHSGQWRELSSVIAAIAVSRKVGVYRYYSYKPWRFGGEPKSLVWNRSSNSIFNIFCISVWI